MSGDDSVMASIRKKMRSRFGMADDGACCGVKVTQGSDYSDESVEHNESDGDRGQQINE